MKYETIVESLKKLAEIKRRRRRFPEYQVESYVIKLIFITYYFTLYSGLDNYIVFLSLKIIFEGA